MVAVQPFVWALGLRLVSEAVRRNFNFWQFFLKILYQATSKLFLVFKDIFHVRWINVIPYNNAYGEAVTYNAWGPQTLVA